LVESTAIAPLSRNFSRSPSVSSKRTAERLLPPVSDWTRVEAVERGEHAEGWPKLWEEMTEVRRSVPGGGVVTAEAVWSALAELEDPEIP
jgi:hypothetical protein